MISTVDLFMLPYLDAFIVAKSKGRNISLCGTFVHSPLVWALAGKYSTSATSIWNNKPIRFGISRLGSGSHTMAYYAAMKNRVDPANLEFVVANDINGLLAGFGFVFLDCIA